MRVAPTMRCSRRFQATAALIPLLALSWSVAVRAVDVPVAAGRRKECRATTPSIDAESLAVIAYAVRCENEA